MKLSSCSKCSLCKTRQHLSLSKGQKPASVMIVLGRELRSDKDNKRFDEFIRVLNYELKRDFYFSFAIKCFTKEKVSYENLKICQFWLKREINKINPHLIIMLGKLSTISVLSKEIEPKIQQNVFYKSNTDPIKYFFRCEPIMGNIDNLDFNLHKLVLFLREFYKC